MFLQLEFAKNNPSLRSICNVCVSILITRIISVTELKFDGENFEDQAKNGRPNKHRRDTVAADEQL